MEDKVNDYLTFFKLHFSSEHVRQGLE